MFGLDMLDAFIGLITVYLTLSLMVTAIGEGVSQVLCFRGRVLNLSIQRLLGQGLARDIFAHRRIQDLQKDQKRKPSYIPDRVFAEVLVDVVLDKRFPELRAQPAQLISALEAELNGDQEWQKTLLDFWRQSNTDIEVFLSKIVGWFNDTGDRAHGWFKRQLGWLTFFIGLVVAVALNADTIHIYHTLTESSELRQAYVNRALQLTEKEEAQSLATVCQDLKVVREDCTALAVVKAQIPEVLPLVGWDESAPIRKELGKIKDGVLWLKSTYEPNAGTNTGSYTGQEKKTIDLTVLLLSLFGWILTAFALSLGAPFWFDLLQKLVQVRSSLKTEPWAGSETGSSGEQQRGEAESTKIDAPVRGLVRATPAGLAPESLERFDSFQSQHLGLSVINALWLARFSSLAYSEREAVEAQAAQWGAEARFGEHRDTQWLLARGARAAVLAFRGTELDRIADVLTGITIAPIVPPWGGVGKVHEGFAAELEAAWPEIQAQLNDLNVVRDQVPLWVCGHSLGGALALLTALRMLQPELQDGTKGTLFGALYTYAQPRVGDSVFADHADRRLAGRYFRAVNNRDIVSLLPLPEVDLPRLGRLEYKHAGRVIYFNEFGQAILDPPFWYRGLDKVTLTTDKEKLKARLKETVGDHSIANYILLLHRAVGSPQTSREAAVGLSWAM